MVTVGSLFDGIGGAPLCATMCGVIPVWYSEIEPIPISITKRHFPNMKHYGDITKINGAEVEPVDIIVGGSPCQDLSVAGKRAGLDGARSGLFMEQIRIVKEMRDATNGIYPRFMVWENVPGAFSSNGGEDFRIVLEETARVADPTIRIPRCEAWSNAGSILGDGFSISWRVIDAQYWGVPQRRRRIYLVADFGGQSAPEILFERDGLSGHFTESGTPGQGTAGDAEKGACQAVAVDAYNHTTTGDVAVTLTAASGSSPTHSGPMVYMRGFGGRTSQDGITPTLEAAAGMGGNNQPIICMPINTQVITRHNALGNGTGFGLGDEGDPAYTLQAGHEHGVICLQGNGIDQADTAGCNGKGQCECVSYTLNTIDRPAICFEPRSQDGVPRVSEYDLCPTLNTAQGGQRQPCIYSMQRSDEYVESKAVCTESARQYKSATDLVVAGVDCRNARESEEIYPTLQAKENGGQSLNYSGALRKGATVRRLTPLECERLQGYPDGWTALTRDGNQVSDSARYKALGNSFAIPCALFVIQGCVEKLDKASQQSYDVYERR